MNEKEIEKVTDMVNNAFFVHVTYYDEKPICIFVWRGGHNIDVYDADDFIEKDHITVENIPTYNITIREVMKTILAEEDNIVKFFQSGAKDDPDSC